MYESEGPFGLTSKIPPNLWGLVAPRKLLLTALDNVGGMFRNPMGVPAPALTPAFLDGVTPFPTCQPPLPPFLSRKVIVALSATPRSEDANEKGQLKMMEKP